MKLKFYTVLFFLAVCKMAEAQLYVPNIPVTLTNNSSSQNVGIGTTDPQAKLHVRSGAIMTSDPVFNDINVRINGSSIPAIRFTRYTGQTLGLTYHNAFVGQFLNTPANEYSFAIGTGSSTSGDQDMVTNRMTIMNNGNVGIGNNNPSARFQISFNAIPEFNSFFFEDRAFSGITGANNVAIKVPYAYPGGVSHNASSGFLDLVKTVNGNTILATRSSDNESLGNVGIGTANPTQRLTVKGTVYSTAVKVDLAAGTGPDYVFEPTYTLPSLDSVQLYINQNKHLPEVPSAKEMEANGMNLGEMNVLLLKKVEELTLYMMEANKKISSLGSRLNNFEKQK